MIIRNRKCCGGPIQKLGEAGGNGKLQLDNGK